MERGSRILIFLLIFAGLYFFMNGESDSPEVQPIIRQELIADAAPKATAVCDLWTEEYHATVDPHGAVLSKVEPLTAKYRKGDQPIQLITTGGTPQFSPLFSDFRTGNLAGQDRDWLVKSDIQNYRITQQKAKLCVLEYSDEQVKIRKTFRALDQAYTIELETEITNLGTAAKPYALSLATATYLLDSEVESKMFRMNPLMTHVECVTPEGKATREERGDFDPDDFEDKERFPKTPTNPGDWSQPAGQAHIVAASSAYFTNAIAHDAGPLNPVCQLQIDARGQGDDAAALYKSRLSYPEKNLDAGKIDTYKSRAFIGPKEREALADAGDHFSELIDLGFFSFIAKGLVGYLLLVYSVVKSWGLAIVILTITARLLLFPFTWPSIRNMIQMRELKPEMEKLTKKFKDDPQGKGLAQMELWKKHGVNPMKGCLPQLVSMPVWFALYTTLQTAVELYHIPFLWFPDLSEADPLYILPFVIGGTFFLQQKLMPMQADPAQQKMMMYLMPTMFTVFMLFLPAGLGVYMFTNSLLGIVQQQIVERHAKSSVASNKGAEIAAREKSPLKKKKSQRS